MFKLLKSFCDLHWHIPVQTIRDDILGCHGPINAVSY